ncbi:hypothetical protein QQ045_016528 [Rhodiola kirilowii]
MSVVGFDIGNENLVIAAVKQRGIDVLLNEESNRETPAVVCFGEKQRFLGVTGAASAMMNPKSTVTQVKRLIGRSFRDPAVQEELKMCPFETSEGQDGGILIHLKYMGEISTFTPVQMMGMLFGHLKDITEQDLKIPVSDCVIGIPSYFTDLQRRAYLDAAAIAGLKPLRLMHDCTATALSYGIYKTDFSTAGPTYVAFVDIGHCDTQICIASFDTGHMRVLSHTFDSSLGGRDFDAVLFHHFAAQFKVQYKIDVYSNPRACIRLRAACEKLKKVLSANPEAPLNIECLMDEKDVKSFIRREEFEALSSSLIDRITIPCKKALADAGLTPDKVHTVELVGSGSRVPAISRALTSVFHREPRRTLNASECVARGCALQCAMLSPIFRVREYEVQDSFPFSVGLSLDDGPIRTMSNGIIFKRGQPIPSIKVITLQGNRTLNLETFYADPNELPHGLPTKFSCFVIDPSQVAHSGNVKVKVKIQLNLHGIVTVDSASLLEDHMDNSTTRSDPQSNEEDTDMNENRADDGTKKQSKWAHSSDDDTRKGGSRRIFIPVTEYVYGGMTKTELSEAQGTEQKLCQQDRVMEQTKNRKNALESYVYDMRNKLFSTYRSFASDQERENISRTLQETEEWLYDDGDDETESAYASKLEDLKTMVDPIENRYKDEESRAQATRELLNTIVEYRMHADSLPSMDKELIIKECNKAEQWLRERTQQQDSLPKNTDPVLWSSEIKHAKNNLETYVSL